MSEEVLGLYLKVNVLIEYEVGGRDKSTQQRHQGNSGASGSLVTSVPIVAVAVDSVCVIWL